MKTMKLALCIAAIAIASCNNSSTSKSSSASQADTTAVTGATTDAGATSTTTTTQISPANVANLNCPVCGKPLVTCTDTATYADKLLGFDSKQCNDAFMQNPSGYPVTYK